MFNYLERIPQKVTQKALVSWRNITYKFSLQYEAMGLAHCKI